MNTLFIKICYLSVMWTILNSGYVIASSLITSIYGKTGFLMQVVLYFTNMSGSLTAPFIVYWIFGLKWSIVVGATCYLSFFLGLNFEMFWIYYGYNVSDFMMTLPLYAGCMITGFGVGIVKSQQNTWISSMLTVENYDYYIGVYTTILNSYGIIGYTFSYILIYFQININTLVWILFFMTIIIIVMMIFTSSPQIDNTHVISIKIMVKLLVEPKIWYIFLISQYYANIVIFSYSILPLCVKSYDVILLNYLIYSIILCISSYIIGSVSKMVGSTVLILSAVVVSLFVSIFYLIICHLEYITVSNYLILIVGVICAISEAFASYISLKEINRIFPDNRSINSISRAYYSFSCMILSLFAIYAPSYAFVFSLNITTVVIFIVYKFLRLDNLTNFVHIK